MAGHRSDSDSSPPRSKRRHGRSPSPSRSPPARIASRSPTKRSRRVDDPPSRDRDRETEWEKDRERSSDRSKTSRHHSGERRERNNERERDLELVRDKNRDRDKDKYKDKDRERLRESLIDRDRDWHREKDRRRDSDRNRERVSNDRRDKERSRERNDARSKDRTRDSDLDTSDHSNSPRKRSRSPSRRAFSRSEVKKDHKYTERERDSDDRRDRDRSRERNDSRDQESSREISPTKRGSHSSPLRASSRSEMQAEVLKDHKDSDREAEEDDSLAKMRAAEAELEDKNKAKEVEKPSFEYSGKLAAETNRFRGVTLQFTEPPEARKPNTRWRLYTFKNAEPLDEPLYIHRQSCYLFGRERRVADVPTDHPSCSKQHAVIQYRLVEKELDDGTMKSKVSPYLMDLGSTNGTFLNGNRIEPQRYYELLEKDTIKFGNSSREYVLLHENSAG